MTSLMIIFFFVGAVALLSAILLLIFPEMFLKMSEVSNQIFLTDENAIKYRYGLGILLFLISLFMFYSLFRIFRG